MMSFFLYPCQMDFFDDFERDVADFEVDPEPYENEDFPPWSIVNEENARAAKEYNEKFYEKSAQSFDPEPMQEGDDSDDGVRGSTSQWRPEQLDFLGRLSEDQRVIIEDLQWQGLDTAMFPESRRGLVENFNKSQDDFQIFESRYGYGLRTLKPLKATQHIGVYTGAVIPREQGERLPAIYDKLVPAPNPDESIVGDVIPWNQKLNYVAFANDPGFFGSRDTGFIKGESNANVATITDAATGETSTVMYATKNIGAGKEILYYYGYPYWSDHPIGTYFPGAKEKVAAYRQHVTDLKNNGASPEDYPPVPPEYAQFYAEEQGSRKRRKPAAPQRVNI